MHEATRCLTDALKIAETARKKGDALRGRRPDDEVVRTYESGCSVLNAALGVARNAREGLDARSPPLDDDARALLGALVEARGVLGGLLQRLGRFEEARASYCDGELLESRFGLSSTYNRLNRVKQDLLRDDGMTLSALAPDIDELVRTIRDALSADQRLGDKGWAWADLGDCLALRGETREAAVAYANFIAKAEIKSPERTLDVLRQIATKLRMRGDPGATRLQDAIEALQAGLHGVT